jgi:hypothetical protein
MFYAKLIASEKYGILPLFLCHPFHQYILTVLLPLVPHTLILFDRPVTVFAPCLPIDHPLLFYRSARVSTCGWYKIWGIVVSYHYSCYDRRVVFHYIHRTLISVNISISVSMSGKGNGSGWHSSSASSTWKPATADKPRVTFGTSSSKPIALVSPICMRCPVCNEPFKDVTAYKHHCNGYNDC